MAGSGTSDDHAPSERGQAGPGPQPRVEAGGWEEAGPRESLEAQGRRAGPGPRSSGARTLREALGRRRRKLSPNRGNRSVENSARTIAARGPRRQSRRGPREERPESRARAGGGGGRATGAPPAPPGELPLADPGAAAAPFREHRSGVRESPRARVPRGDPTSPVSQAGPGARSTCCRCGRHCLGEDRAARRGHPGPSLGSRERALPASLARPPLRRHLRRGGGGASEHVRGGRWALREGAVCARGSAARRCPRQREGGRSAATERVVRGRGGGGGREHGKSPGAPGLLGWVFPHCSALHGPAPAKSSSGVFPCSFCPPCHLTLGVRRQTPCRPCYWCWFSAVVKSTCF